MVRKLFYQWRNIIEENLEITELLESNSIKKLYHNSPEGIKKRFFGTWDAHSWLRPFRTLKDNYLKLVRYAN